jgi:SAM-dependent methyltransferase
MNPEIYGASFAALYDTFYSGKPYGREAEFIDGQIRARLGKGKLRLLELACGTGNHSFEFERLGYQVSASDLSVGMIEVARVKAKERGSAVDFAVADMRQAGDADAGRFDAVVCLFDSLGYLLENNAILECLRNVRRQLRSGGVCVFECWHAAAMLTNRDTVRVRQWPQPSGELMRISRTTCDHARQCCEVRFEVTALRADGTWRRFEEIHRNRYFLPRELEFFLQVAGLSPVACQGDYDASEPVTERTWHLVFTAIAD